MVPSRMLTGGRLLKVCRRSIIQGSGSLLLTQSAKAAFISFGTYAPSSNIAVSVNGRYLTKNGSPFLILADSAQSLVNIYGSDLTTYLSTRASQGFNAIQVDLVSTAYIGATTPYAIQTAGGPVYAFTNNGAITSSWAANSAYWTAMDSIIAAINSYGMVACLNPYEGSTNSGGGSADLVNAGNSACYSYGQFVGNRYKRYNVTWVNLGNDFAPTTSAQYQATLNLAQGIMSADTTNLISIEIDQPSTSFQNDGAGSYASTFGARGINGSYTYAGTYDYTLVAYNDSGTSFGGVAGTNNSPPCPVVGLEFNYVGENIYGDGTTALTYRLQPWQLMLAGGLGGYIFGTHWTYNFPSGWQSELAQGVSDARVWKNFFNSIAFQTLQPDQARALATTGSSGWNTPNMTGTGSSYSSDQYICMAADSLTGGATLAVVYYRQASQSITIDLSKFAATITAQWVDPTNGAKTTVSGSPFSNGGTQSFAPSGNNAAGDVDWALLLTA
jgi:hypothetical protein